MFVLASLFNKFIKVMVLCRGMNVIPVYCRLFVAILKFCKFITFIEFCSKNWKKTVKSNLGSGIIGFEGCNILKIIGLTQLFPYFIKNKYSNWIQKPVYRNSSTELNSVVKFHFKIWNSEIIKNTSSMWIVELLATIMN